MKAIYKNSLSMARRYALEPVIEAIWPSSCPICHRFSATNHMLCNECWLELNILTDPRCEFCGMEIEGEGAPICEECYNLSRSWDYGGSAVRYEGVGRKMVLRLKNMRAENLADLMANIAVSSNLEFFEDIDIVIPIPLHWRKYLRRGFNQAGLLAYHISKAIPAPVNERALKRNRATKGQTQFRHFDGRFENLQNAFSLGHAEGIAGKRLLLVDDVMTSGASFEHATLALRPANPRSIAVFAFARAG